MEDKNQPKLAYLNTYGTDMKSLMITGWIMGNRKSYHEKGMFIVEPYLNKILTSVGENVIYF